MLTDPPSPYRRVGRVLPCRLEDLGDLVDVLCILAGGRGEAEGPEGEARLVHRVQGEAAARVPAKPAGITGGPAPFQPKTPAERRLFSPVHRQRCWMENRSAAPGGATARQC